jgi:S-formylglutathione hydrolase FrmB
MKIKLFLFLIANSIGCFASQIDTLQVLSKSMNKSISNIVILPETYSSQKEGYSVLYLLHGAYGNYKDWSSKVPEIKTYADLYNLIIVCPDGGFNSWYFDSPVDDQWQYESYFSSELVKTMDDTYNTSKQKSKRAITGLSMGGHGAFYLAFKHPDIWGAAGSMSGGMDLRPFPNNWDLEKRLGSLSEHPENWEKNSIINMVHLLDEKSLKLIFDCGTEDFFFDANKRLHEKLLERNIPHDYAERPGKHNWNYWSNAIKYQLVFFDVFFNA